MIQRRHVFCFYHPAVIFLYLSGVIVLAMLTMHPIYIGMAFVCSSLYAIYLRGIRQYWRSLRWLLLLFGIVACANPLLNSLGLTVLFYLGDIPITLEALLYGVCSGGMLLTVLVWFTCYQVLMTNDKFLYLFGKIAPTLALMVSMIFKFIPETQYKARCITTAHHSLFGEAHSKKGKLHQAIRTASILMSWCMEDSIETADSMKSRGYGSTKRTHYVRYQINRYDRIALVILSILILGNVLLIVTQANQFTFYPTFSELAQPVWSYLLYGLLLLYPLILQAREALVWKLQQ